MKLGNLPPDSVPLLQQGRARGTVDSWARAMRYFVEFRRHNDMEALPPSSSDAVAFGLYLLNRRSLAPATAHRLWGALEQACRLLGWEVTSSLASSLARQGLRAMVAIPRAPPPGVPVSQLLQAWSRLPRTSLVEQRDAAIVLTTILLGARPIDITLLGRDDPRVLQIDDYTVRIRFANDKSRKLSKRFSRWLFVPRVPAFDLGDVLLSWLRHIPRNRVVVSPTSMSPIAPLFVRVDEAGFGRGLSVDTVSNILMRFLSSVGLVGVRGQARQIRAYSAASAFELGVPLDEILLHFRWKDARTFLDHYHRWMVEPVLDPIPPEVAGAPRDGSRVALAFAAALQRRLQR